MRMRPFAQLALAYLALTVAGGCTTADSRLVCDELRCNSGRICVHTTLCGGAQPLDGGLPACIDTYACADRPAACTGDVTCACAGATVCGGATAGATCNDVGTGADVVSCTVAAP